MEQYIKYTSKYHAILLMSVAIAVFYLVSHSSYLLFHFLVEIIGVVVAVAAFFIVWNSWHYIENNYFLLVGVSFVFTSFIDLLHLLAYRGVNLVGNPGDADLPMQLWVAARTVSSLSFAVAPYLVGRTAYKTRHLFVIYFIATTGLVASIFYFRNFPLAYTEDGGLTGFKIAMEGVITLLYAGGVLGLYLKRMHFDSRVRNLIISALVMQITREIAFTVYAEPGDRINFAGHILHLVSIYLLYLGIVEASLMKPYRLMFKSLKDSETALKESEARYRSLVEASPDAILVHTLGTVMYANPASAELLGYKSPDVLLGKNIFEIFHTDSHEAVEARIASVRKGANETPLAELNVVRSDGKKIPVEVTGRSIKYKNKPSLQTLLRDISDQKKRDYERDELTAQLAQKSDSIELLADRLKKERDMLKVIMENSGSMLVYLDPRFDLINANTTFLRYSGLTTYEIIGKNFFELFPDGEIKEIFEHVRAAGKPREFKAQLLSFPRMPGVKKTYADWSLIPITNIFGAVEGLVLSLQDVTERISNEIELRSHADQLERLSVELSKFRMAVDNAADHVVITDKEGKIIYANDAAERITGYAKHEMIGRSPALWGNRTRMSDGQGTYTEASVWQDLGQSETFEGEVLNIRKDGTNYIADLHIAPVYSEEGETVFFIAIERDVTKIKEIDRAKDEFISFASHQLRTPLTSVSLSAELLLRGIMGNVEDKQKKYLLEIYKSTHHMAELVNTLLNVSRIEMGTFVIKREELDLTEKVGRILEDMYLQIRHKRLILDTQYQDSMPTVYFDKNILRIALENLVSNAIRYTPEGGIIRVEIAQSGVETIISVKDSGCGIPEEARPYIFLKSYRASNARNLSADGLGLGLYIAKWVIEKAGGRIWFDSIEGSGSIFHIAIPASIEDINDAE